jgi:lysozyme
MIDVETCVQRLAIEEGCVLHTYVCPAGYKTIGIGRNLVTNPLTDEEKKVCGDVEHGITKNAAFYLCRNDVKKVMNDLDDKFPWWKNLNDDRQFVMVSMCFQLGVYGLSKFKRMLSYLSTGYYKKAAAECLDSSFAKQCPKRANRNAQCIESGVWQWC